jgi:hypothetical protein
MCGVTPPFPYMLHGFLLKCRTILLLLLYLQIYVLVLKHLGLILKLDEKQIFMINTNKKSIQHGIRRHIQGGSNMTGTDFFSYKPHCAAAVRP